MNFDSIKELSEDAQILLGIYAYSVSGTYTGLEDIIKILTKHFKNYDSELSLEELRIRGMIEDDGYSWYSHSRVYKIPKEQFAPILIYFLTYRRDLIQTYKEIGIKATQLSNIRRVIGELTDSDFTVCQKANTLTISDVQYIIGLEPTEQFKPLLSNLSHDAFHDYITKYLLNLCENDILMNPDLFYELIKSNKNITLLEAQKLNSQVDLYRYFALGIMPEKEPNANDYVAIALAAVRCVNTKNYSTAVKLFALSLKFRNKLSETKNMFTNILLNYYLILAYAHEGSPDSKNKLRIFSNKKETEQYPNIYPSKIIADTILGINAKEHKSRIKEFLRYIYEDNLYEGYANLYFLIANYLGYRDMLQGPIPSGIPNLAIYRHELSAYLNLDEEEKERLKSLYGDAPALTSIYRKAEWEMTISKIENLLNAGNGNITSGEKQVRMAYLMQHEDYDDIEPREQTRLKNGEWGSGKAIASYRYDVGNIDFMDEADRRIHARYRSSNNYNLTLQDVIEDMVPESRLYKGRWAPYTLIEVEEEKPYVVINRIQDTFVVSSNVKEVDEHNEIIIKKTGRDKLSFIKLTSEQRTIYNQLLNLGTFPLEAEESLKNLLPRLGVKVEIHSDLLEGGSTLRTMQGTSTACVQIKPNKDGYYDIAIGIKPVEGGKQLLSLGKGDATYVDEVDGERVWVNRDIAGEKKTKKVLKKTLDKIYGEESGYDKDYTKYLLDPKENVTIMEAEHLLPFIEYIQENPNIIYAEWAENKKIKIKKATTSKGDWSVQIKKNNSWFEVEGDIAIDNETVLSIADLLELVNNSKSKFVKLENGEYLMLSEQLHRQLSAINSVAARERGKIHISPFSAAVLGDDNLNGEITFMADKNLLELRKKILASSEYCPAVPKDLNADMRPYQVEGYQWIARLNSWGAGALLADDMGLGKTLQSIAFFLLKASEGPTLVVAPASVAPNWGTELDKFAPSLNHKFLNQETDRAKAIEEAGPNDVIITTYGLLLSVSKEITEKKWNVACLDEAHIIKNRGAKTSGVAMSLQADNRIMLTGTPIQNHLGELWNLFQFVNPGLLGTYANFQQRFIIPIERDEDKWKQEALDKLVHPFMLRRTKNAVLKELPDKTEIYQKIELSTEELAIYETIRQKAEKMLEEHGDEALDLNVLAEITRLRQASCSSRLIDSKWKGQSSKVNALLELLEDVVEGGNRALVFSQFTSFLDIVQEELKKAGIEYLYIDGSTPVAQRTKLVKSFQEGKCPVFVISLKAGGLGLNLTGANYVFHLDPWWNPAIEQQATDRAYRIGQNQAVTVYHLISQNTIEEKIVRLHKTKKALAENILEGTDISHKLSGKDLLEMIAK